ncbi:MAG: ATP-binding protein [Bacteroidota bacterium]
MAVCQKTMKSKNEGLQFNVRASLIKRLGGEIIRDTASAIAELVKNSYDADASVVKFDVNTKEQAPSEYYQNIGTGFIQVDDDGAGMSWEHVRGGWMNFSFSHKEKEAVTDKKRSPVGGQGMGRLGTLRLGDHVELFTSTGAENEHYHVAFNWAEFTDQKILSDVPLFSEKLSHTKPRGTTLLIFPLKDPAQWNVNYWQELVDQVTNKVFLFIDRKSFRVLMSLNGKAVELGKIVKGTEFDAKVYFENVWLKMSPALIKEVMEFWSTNKMLRAGFAAEERAQQVVLIVRDEKEKRIVGLSTAATVTFKQLNSHNFYLYRSIILPEYRQPGLASKVIVETRDFLESFSKMVSSNRCIGLLTFVENPKVQQFRREAVWPASKMVFIGTDKEGRHIRVYYFEGARI